MFYSGFAWWLFCARARVRAYRCRAGIYPPAFFSPGPAESAPQVYDEGGRRGNNMNDTMASPRGPGATITSRDVQLIRSGIPLSLTYIYPPHLPTPNISLTYP